jgi:hypothetical protein
MKLIAKIAGITIVIAYNVAILAAVAEAHNVHGTGNTGAASQAGSAGNQGGRYTMGDEFQPWPQREMQQFAKARFEPYRGEQRSEQQP